MVLGSVTVPGSDSNPCPAAAVRIGGWLSFEVSTPAGVIGGRADLMRASIHSTGMLSHGHLNPP